MRNTLNLKISLPISKFCVVYKAIDAISFPSYTGSTFRGAFGHQLKECYCITQKDTCAGCSKFSDCLYALIFEGGSLIVDENGVHSLDKPNPYIIEPLNIGDRNIEKDSLFSINVVIFGKAQSYYEKILRVFEKAGMQGFTSKKIRAKLSRIYVLDNLLKTIIYSDECPNYIKSHDLKYDFEIPNEANGCRIELITPLRIHYDGKPINQNLLTAADFLLALVRRINNLFETYDKDNLLLSYLLKYEELELCAKRIEICNKNLKWFDWKRMSSRQEKFICLGGIIGSFELHGESSDLSQFLFYLYVGTLLHVGKSAVMGLGKYSVELV